MFVYRMAGEIRVGTSGWSYPGGRGTWNKVFYPARRARGFDELTYYAEHFDTVEVNSTFYRPPEADMARRWVERTPPGFLFSVKLFQKFTHPDMFITRTGTREWEPTQGDFDQFRTGIAPVVEAERLGALLIQFPASFRAEHDTRDYLDWLLAGFRGYPLAVELRHRTWSDTAEETRACLARHDTVWVSIDEPRFRDSIAAPAGGFGPYIRLHGRNADAWWTHDESEDRYNYLYSPSELVPIAADARRHAATGRRVLVYTNNHFSAKSVANAAMLKHELGQPVPGEYTRDMVDRYPALAGVVRTSGLPW